MNCPFTFHSQTVNTITKKLLILYLLLNQFFHFHFNFPSTLTKQQHFTAFLCQSFKLWPIPLAHTSPPLSLSLSLSSQSSSLTSYIWRSWSLEERDSGQSFSPTMQCVRLYASKSAYVIMGFLNFFGLVLVTNRLGFVGFVAIFEILQLLARLTWFCVPMYCLVNEKMWERKRKWINFQESFFIFLG